ncbi:MAG: hypothetical protein M3Q48_05660, partial [Actinomycetota bacterium]|nr:hypothetical protein [Actinomycetota bacterium]
GESAAVRLLLALERLPQAPALPTPAGGVVVVVGEPAVAVLSARVAAEQLGQTDADVVVASPGRRRPERIASPADARQRRLAWRRCLAPTVVAICTEEGLQATGWAREVLEALEPDAVWGAVPANAKPEDVAAWAGRMGGVDALAVAGCAATVTPAAVLGAGIPVAALEGRRATPAAWTALLVERLAA